MNKKKAKSKPKAAKKSKPKRVAKAKVKKPTKSKAKKPAKKSKRKAKKASSKKPPKPGVIAPLNGVLLGYVEDYFAKIGVVALTLKAGIKLGDNIHILGHTTNFEQTVGSMQIDHQSVTQARPKDGVGIKVTARSRRGDHVYLIP